MSSAAAVWTGRGTRGKRKSPQPKRGAFRFIIPAGLGDAALGIAFASVEIGRGIAAIATFEGVGSGVAGQCVIVLVTIQEIVAGAADERVVAIIAVERVVAFAAEQPI